MNQIIDNIMRQIGEYTARHPDGDGQALRTAIEQALTPGEPVAIVVDVYDTPGLQWLCQHPPKRGDRLYTAPQPQPTTVACPSCGSTQVECAVCAAGFTAPQTQQWVGLTDEEVQAFVGAAWSRDVTPAHFIRAIEAKVREKNGGGHDDTALLRQALEALENSRIEYDFHGNPYDEDNANVIKAIAALRERLS
jgi:hypothetical protein